MKTWVCIIFLVSVTIISWAWQRKEFTELPHGWRLGVAIGERYVSPRFGHNIKLSGCSEIDRVEILDVIREKYRGVSLFGDWNGFFFVFPDVKTKADQNRKIKEILPDLDKFFSKTGCALNPPPSAWGN